jgi:hypothetical protein
LSEMGLWRHEDARAADPGCGSRVGETRRLPFARARHSGEETRNFSNGGLPWVASGLDLIVGWLITAVATLFGTPFWFDALQQTISLKGAGPSPAEKKANTGAAA